MIYEKKTIELLADQRLLSRFGKDKIKPNNNIINNININYTKANKFMNISKYTNYIILLIYIYGIKYLD